MDDDGYPEESELKQIAEWPWQDIPGLLAFVRPRWSYPNFWCTDGAVLKVSTGGWSGNEDLMRAMQQNRAFWSLCWMSSRRGGHYEFDLSRVKGLGGGE
jgi:hypothetical protein